MKKITLCADDFAYNSSVSEGILILLEKKRLSAVSCMSLSELWPEYAMDLKKYSDHIDIGLHFDLTHFAKIQKKKYSVKKLLLLSFLQNLSQNEIEKILHQQIELFIKYFNKKPDFIDGHEHIHVFSAIRKAFLKVYETYFPEHQSYIRVPLAKKNLSLKSKIIAYAGAKQLKASLETSHIPHNLSFSGVYNLKPQNYRLLFKKFLNEIEHQGLIMCHPGLASTDQNDPISAARFKEFQYFSGEDFLHDLKNISLCKFAFI